jgi:adenylosuccinate lyase
MTQDFSLNPLLALSPLDGRYLKACQSLQAFLSEYGLMRFRVQVEIAWFICLMNEGLAAEKMPEASRAYLLKLDNQFDVEQAQKIKDIEKITAHDVKAVEYYLQNQFDQDDWLKNNKQWIHFACTSEDINNLSHALMLKNAFDQVIKPQLEQSIQMIETRALQYADISMLSRTHGQTASPTTLGKELANVTYRLRRIQQQLNKQSFLGKINGAVGNYNAHQVAFPDLNWLDISKRFIESLGLEFNPMTTQIEPHDYMAEICHTLIQLSTVLIDFARDVWGYIAWGYFTQKRAENEVGSSTMPHKVNPIDFENAEGNLGLTCALCTHFAQKLPISRFQRDLTDSTVIRNLGTALGYFSLALQSLQKGIAKLEANPKRLAADLDNAWEVLAEPIQTVMRKEGIVDAYEQLKHLSRGKQLDAKQCQDFINQLSISNDEKEKLNKLTPENYIGEAAMLTKVFIENKQKS